MSYCVKCGGTGRLLNNEICECQLNIHDMYSDVTCLDVPEQYRGIGFNEGLVTDTWNGSYAKFLQKLHTGISTLEDKGRNYLICSPPSHSKTIFAYSTISRLFRQGVQVFPIYDVLEMRNKISLYDQGRPSDVEAEDLGLFFTAPYVFVRIPSLLTPEVFQMCAMILDRRVRRGGSTIFLFNGSWERIYAADKFENFTPYKGDGSYCTISVHSWREVKKNEVDDIH